MKLFVAGSLLALTVMLAGCAATSTTPSPSPVASRSAPPQVSSTPATTGVYIRSTDPGLEARLPDDWVVIGPTAYEESLMLLLEEIVDPVIHRAIQWDLASVANGQLRDVAVHPTGPVITVAVKPSAGTLEQAVAARRADIEANSVPHTVVSEEPTSDLFLPAYRTEIQSDIAGGVPSRTIEYLVVMEDGRVVVLNGTAPIANADFPNLMSEVARTLAQT